MIFRRLIPLFLLIPAVAPAISKEMQELMRDVALLQQQVRDLQQSQDTKFAALTVMVQQTLDSATKANTAVAVLESGIRGTVQESVRGVVTATDVEGRLVGVLAYGVTAR